jgi:hypothetical protein
MWRRPAATTGSAGSATTAGCAASRQHYHFGPAKIAMYLGRYHEVTISVSGGVADPQTVGAGPATRLTALSTSSLALETLREATPRPPAPSRRQIHRTTRPDRPEAGNTSSPRSTTAPGYGCCAPTPAATRRPRSPSSTTTSPSCSSPSSACKPTFKLGGAPKVPGLSGRRCEDRGVRHPHIVVA